MSADKFAKDLEASRRFDVPVQGAAGEGSAATFQMRLPTPYAWRVAVDRGQGPDGRAIAAQVHRELIEVAVTGWEGVTQRWIDPTGSADPLPFTRANLALLLDNNMDAMDALTIGLAKKDRERRNQLEAVTKN